MWTRGQSSTGELAKEALTSTYEAVSENRGYKTKIYGVCACNVWTMEEDETLHKVT
jgi:hypothetical protein